MDKKRQCQFVKKNKERCKLSALVNKSKCKRHGGPVYVSPGVVVDKQGAIIGIYSGMTTKKPIKYINNIKRKNEAFTTPRANGSRRYWRDKKRTGAVSSKTNVRNSRNTT